MTVSFLALSYLNYRIIKRLQGIVGQRREGRTRTVDLRSCVPAPNKHVWPRLVTTAVRVREVTQCYASIIWCTQLRRPPFLLFSTRYLTQECQSICKESGEKIEIASRCASAFRWLISSNEPTSRPAQTASPQRPHPSACFPTTAPCSRSCSSQSRADTRLPYTTPSPSANRRSRHNSLPRSHHKYTGSRPRRSRRPRTGTRRRRTARLQGVLGMLKQGLGRFMAWRVH